jgi:UDP-glucuronate 4-epimerase
MTVLVTGAAGFIGFHAAQALLARGVPVVGVDCLTHYYDVALKQARLAELNRVDGFRFEPLDLADAERFKALILDVQPERILHLAAQAGVRYSLKNPFAYTHANINGHLSVLEAARALGPALKHVVYASSSSVYGEREGAFKETDAVDAPVSLYAATKRADELMSATYTHLYGLPLTGLRFFTVYGPWGRPDMAYFSFAERMLAGEPIELFNHGRNRRDFTFIDDILPTLQAVLGDTPGAQHRVFNIGGSAPVDTLALVTALEEALGVKAETRMIDAQPGDVSSTWADTTKLEAAYGPAPRTPLKEGVAAFADWFKAWKGQTESASRAS